MEYLRALQLVQLKMLERLDAFCKTHKIEYFLIGGTALGAMRHGGFIPWDDDIDVGMTRKNYEKFKQIVKTSFSDGYFVQMTDTDRYSPFPYVKIRKNGTLFVEWANRKSKMNQGIYLDIFPYDRIPESEALRKRQFFSVQFYAKLFVRKKTPGLSYRHAGFMDIVKEKFRSLLRLPLLLVPDRLILSKLELHMRKYEGSNSTTYACLLFPKYMVETMSHSVLYPIKQASFEGSLYPIPNNIDGYLTTHYGNYMLLPPESDRLGHRPYIVDIGT